LRQETRIDNRYCAECKMTTRHEVNGCKYTCPRCGSVKTNSGRSYLDHPNPFRKPLKAGSWLPEDLLREPEEFHLPEEPFPNNRDGLPKGCPKILEDPIP